MKLVIFDLDGVLIDSMPHHKHAFDLAVNQVVGHSIDTKKLSGRPTKVILEILVENNEITIEEMAVIAQLKKEYTDKYVETIEVNREIKKALSNLRKMGYKLAVASNATKSFVEKVLKKLEITDFFDSIHGHENFVPKPNPQMYTHIMKELKISPEHTLIFEDSPVGLEAAFGSGANVCVVKNDLIEKIEEWLY